jgi:hypothetical protein
MKTRRKLFARDEEPIISGPGQATNAPDRAIFFSINPASSSPARYMQHRLHPNRTTPLFSRCQIRKGNIIVMLVVKIARSRCFFYRCDGCNFNLDIKCASRWQINSNDCHKHAFVPISEQVQFTCQVCGEEGKANIAYLCTICRLLVHHRCAQFQRIVHITAHQHQLTLTYSLPDQDTLYSSNRVFCRLCFKKVNTKYTIYSCKKCSYIVDLNCPSSLGRHRIQKKRDPITVMHGSGFANDPDRHLLITLERGQKRSVSEDQAFRS